MKSIAPMKTITLLIFTAMCFGTAGTASATSSPEEVRIHRKDKEPIEGELLDFGSRTYRITTWTSTLLH